MGRNLICDLLEDVGGYNVHLVSNQQSPFSLTDKLHNLLGIVRTFPSVTDHRVGADDDTGLARESSLVICSENGNILWIDVGPFDKFGSPLHD